MLTAEPGLVENCAALLSDLSAAGQLQQPLPHVLLLGALTRTEAYEATTPGALAALTLGVGVKLLHGQLVLFLESPQHLFFVDDARQRAFFIDEEGGEVKEKVSLSSSRACGPEAPAEHASAHRVPNTARLQLALGPAHNGMPAARRPRHLKRCPRLQI